MEPLDVTDPEAVGPYRLLTRLGAGGMGRVYLARSAGGRTVAVKVVRPELAGDQEFRTRFGREVAAARAVDGAYTAPVVDADPDGAVPWLATAYVLGPSLTEAVQEHGPLPEHSVRALGAGLAQALRAIHAAGLVHRDLKPSNVLLAADGPRVIDFGIARAMDGDSLTRTGVVVGSPGFMCPEQASGLPMGPAGDVFSLGSVLAYAATGHGPFESVSGVAAQLYKVVHDEAELGGLSGTLAPAIAACLAKDPARRPTPEQLSALLAPGGAASVLTDGWLPAPVASALARHAASVMDMETPSLGSAAVHAPTTLDAAGGGTMRLGGGPAVPAAEPTLALGAANANAGAGAGAGANAAAGVAAQPTAGTVPLPPAGSGAPRPSRRGLLIGGGLTALAAVGGAGWALTRGSAAKTGTAAGGSHSAQASPAVPGSSGTAAAAQPVPVQSRPAGVPPQPLWTYNAQGRLSYAPVLVAKGVLHPQGEGLVALDAVSGAEKWARRDVSATYAAVGAGLVLTTGFDGVSGFDSASGQPSWKSATKDPNGHLISPGILLGADDQAVYLLASVLPPGTGTDGTDGALAFSIASKQQLWFQERKKGTSSFLSSMVAGGNLYYTDDQANLVCRSGRDGRQLWFAVTGAQAAFQPAADATQAYCLAQADGLQAVKLTDGTQQWDLKVPDSEKRMYTPVTAADGVVYGTDGTAAVTAWDARTGAVMWSCPLPRKASALSAPVLVKETLFVPGQGDEGVYALDIKQAKIRWTFKNGLNSGDDWYLSTDGERLFAKFGASIYALPPV